jgi:transcriptional regulator with XRE-family HTH domain
MAETSTAGNERGKLMKKQRKARGWTQEQLATVANLTVRTIQRLESGESPAPETLMAIAQAFGMKVEQMNPTSDAISEPPALRYVHLLPRLTTGSDLTAVSLRGHQFQFEHDDDSDPRSISAMKDVLKALSADVVRLHDAKPEDRHLIEEELSRELEGLQGLGYYVFGIVRVVPKFFDEHVLLIYLATIYISHSRSPKIVKTDNMMVLPAMLTDEAAFIGSPALGSEKEELL